MVLIMPSGGCGNSPLSALIVGTIRRGFRDCLQLCNVQRRQSRWFRVGATVAGIAHSHTDRGLLRIEGYSGTSASMRIGMEPLGTRLAKSHTAIPKCEANRRNPVGLALPPTSRKLKTHSTFTEATYAR